MLSKFEKQLTREAKSKLTLDAFVPLPADVDNQRYEPIFDRYPITGKTYTTASGTVVLNEVQYYNGEMVQLYGECTNVAQVSEELAGSGYKPMTMRQADGRETAIVQFWSHQLTDTSLRPYNAMFMIVACRSRRYPRVAGVHQSRRERGIERAVDARRLLRRGKRRVRKQSAAIFRSASRFDPSRD